MTNFKYTFIFPEVNVYPKKNHLNFESGPLRSVSLLWQAESASVASVADALNGKTNSDFCTRVQAKFCCI